MTTWRLNELTKAALALAAVLQVLSMLGAIGPLVVTGFVALPWSTIPAIVVLCSLRFPSVRFDLAGTFGLLVLLIITAMSAVAFAFEAGGSVAAAVMATAVVEEVTFRLAIPLVLVAMLVRFGISRPVAIAVGLGASAVLFVLLPGHLQQFNGLGTSSVFLAFAAIMSYSVWRSGLLLPAVAAHSAVNFVTLLNRDAVLAADTRIWVVAATLIALMLVSVSAAERREEARRKEVVIDLRDSVLSPKSERAYAPGAAD